MDDKLESSVDVRVLVELAVESITLPVDTGGGRLAADVRANAARAGYLKSPDGWFVPVPDLFERVEDLAELVHFEMLERDGEFDVLGGFEIIIGQGSSLGISPGSSFRFAVDLAHMIIDLQQGSEGREVFVSNQEVWRVGLRGDELRISVPQAAGHQVVEFVLPAEQLRARLRVALGELKRFAAGFEPAFLAYQDAGVTSESIRWTFGLDK